MESAVFKLQQLDHAVDRLLGSAVSPPAAHHGKAVPNEARAGVIVIGKVYNGIDYAIHLIQAAAHLYAHSEAQIAAIDPVQDKRMKGLGYTHTLMYKNRKIFFYVLRQYMRNKNQEVECGFALYMSTGFFARVWKRDIEYRGNVRQNPWLVFCTLEAIMK
jgi:hypothetical protein